MFGNIFNGKKVLVTGHTGFKGSWLCIWLNEMGADVVGYALAPQTQQDNFVVSNLEKKINHVSGDIRDFHKLLRTFHESLPEFVFHLAAQPIVRAAYEMPKETYDINVGGTVNLLECCRLTDSVQVVVNVTSDKCYENKEWVWGYRETDPIGGRDPYSSSKGCAELIATAYSYSFFNSESASSAYQIKSLACARAGNVIGGGDWQRDRIVPDCIRALSTDKPIEVRNPRARRPWQHVLEPLSGYLLLSYRMSQTPEVFSGAWNFGPESDSVLPVGDLVNMVKNKWGGGGYVLRTDKHAPYEAHLLSLDISKAKSYLKWFPVWNVDTAVQMTVDWYKNYEKQDPYQLCLNQIKAYKAQVEQHQSIWLGSTPQ